MELRHLRYFLALADELHFGRAAQALAISQPPLTVAIQQLEAEVGAPLFLRNSRGVKLTAAGEALVPKARHVLAQAQGALREAREVASGQAGRLVIGFAGTMLYRGLPQMLARFQAAHPRLRFSLCELSSSEQVVDLLHDRLDAGFVHITQVPAGLSQILVSSQPLVACLPSGHALARHERLPVAALAGQPFALITQAVSPDYYALIVSLCAAAGFSAEGAHELRHWLSVVSLVAQGLAVALVPAAMQQAGMAGVAFVPLDDADGALPRYDTHCLWKPGRDQPALAAFLDQVRGVARAGEAVAASRRVAAD